MSNYDDLNAFEVSEAEKTAKMSIGSISDDDVPKIGLFGALAWQHVRRSEPDLRYEDYMRRVKPSEPTTYLFGDDEDEDDESTPEAEAAGFPEPQGPDAGAGGGEGVVVPGDGDRAE
jgi:hypothetical protein